MQLPRKSYVGTEKCGLCRLNLPWDDFSTLDAWETTFRASLCSDSDENVFKITDSANFSNTHDGQIDMTLTGSQQNQSITIINWTRRNQRKETHSTAFCFHDFCYSILKWQVKSCTNSDIYRLSQILSLNSVAWDNWYREDSVSKQTFANLANDNPSSLALFPISQLPVELRNIVWGYVGLRTAYSAFTLVTKETSRLARSLKFPSCRSVSLDRGSQISVKMISVFGISYIQAFENGEGSKIIPGVVERLKFVMVLGGICAIKLFGGDWEMEWLGKIPVTGHIWYGMISDVGSSLKCSFNDLYCTRISSSGSTKNQILWDKSDIPASLSYPDAGFFGLDQDVQDAVQNPKTCCFGYLSLFNGNEYANGLTVYLSGNGIIGLESHFVKTSQLSGSRHGCPKYFPLGLNERIAFAWLRIANRHSPVHAAPALMIRTTLGRTYEFGAYILPALVRSKNYRWILLGTSGYVTGFYFEKPTLLPVIIKLGVTRHGSSQPKVHPMPQYFACKTPSIPSAGPDAGLFFSVALLNNMKKVELCRLESRCIGIMIHYLKAPPVVLGQWRTSNLSRHTSIYIPDASTVHFKSSKSGRHQFVSNVRFSADKSRDAGSQIFNIPEAIVWWFSKFDDVICSWSGKVLTVPEESIMTLK